MIFKARHKQWNLKDAPLLMGVINVTPDSFSDGGDCVSPDQVKAKVAAFEREGADIIDLGAESSRPGALEITADEELDRLLPALKAIREISTLPVSIDTTKASVARACLEAGAEIINDISGLKADVEMARVVAEFDAGIVIMHRRGDAANMHGQTRYAALLPDVVCELQEGVDIAQRAGICYKNIVIDPGIGFSKTADQNLSLLKHLDEFCKMNYPVLIGTSRKSFIGEVTGQPVGERVFGTAASVALAVNAGASIVRVHDVAAMRDVIRVSIAIIKAD